MMERYMTLQRIAESPDTPAETLEALSYHVDWMVRSAVARNPGTPEQGLEALLDDDHKNVRIEAVNQRYLRRKDASNAR